MNIEEAVKTIKVLIGLEEFNKLSYIENKAIETLLTAYEKEKRLAEANLKDSKEFQDNMCNYRCILNSKVEELKQELEKEKEKNEKLQQIIIINEELYNRETKRLGNIISELLEE